MGYQVNTPGIGEIKACGDTKTQPDLSYVKSLEVSMKQEATRSLVS